MKNIVSISNARKDLQPGKAVRKLVHLRQKLSFPIKGKSKEQISKRVNDYLYSQGNR
jgi:hypothetical protein